MAPSLVLPRGRCFLSLYGVAATAKQTREAMLDGPGRWIHAAMERANGIYHRHHLARHALRNASMRVVTVLGLQAVGLSAVPCWWRRVRAARASAR